MAEIRTKRVYERAVEDDGFRVLVDGLWPRGVSRERARVDLWLKSVAPSAVLRKWFGHDPVKWEEFKTRYFAELDSSPSARQQLVDRASRGRVTLVYSAKDEEHNQAVALKEYLSRWI